MNIQNNGRRMFIRGFDHAGCYVINACLIDISIPYFRLCVGTFISLNMLVCDLYTVHACIEYSNITTTAGEYPIKFVNNKGYNVLHRRLLAIYS